MAQPTDTPTRHIGGEMVEQAGDQAIAVDADNEIAQRIQKRYGDSPGVIPMGTTLGLAQRISRWSTGRLPLLDEIQRRWEPRSSSYLQGALALPYARPAAAPVMQPLPGTVPLSATAPGSAPTPMGRVGLQRAALARPAGGASAPSMPMVEARRAHAVRAAARSSDPDSTSQQRHLSGPGERVVQRHEKSSGPAHTGVATTAGISPPAGASPQAGPVASTSPRTRPTEGAGIQRVAEARTVSRTAPSARALGAAIARRHLSGPAERAIQQPGAWPELGVFPDPPHLASRAVRGRLPQARLQMATVTLAHAGPTTVTRSNAHLDPAVPAGPGAPPPEGGGAPHLDRAQAMPQPSTISGGPRVTIQQGHLSGQARRTVQRIRAGQRPRALPGPVPRQDRTTVEAPPSEAVSQTARGGAQPTTGVRAAPSRPGEATSRPASGGVQPETGIRLAPATATTTGDLGASILQRHLAGPVERAFRRGSSPPAAAYPSPGLILRSFAPGMAGSADPQTVHLARQTFEAAPVIGQPPAPADGQDQLDSQALGLGQNTEVAAAAGKTPSTATPGPVWMPLSRAAGRIARPSIMRRPAMPLARSIQPGTGAVDTAPGPAGQPYPVSQELLLSPAAERGAARSEGGSAPSPSSSTGQSGLVVTHWLQRAPAEGSPATPPTGGPTPPSAAAPSAAAPSAEPPVPEGPDLERLADQVYMILERRLIMERESLGL